MYNDNNINRGNNVENGKSKTGEYIAVIICAVFMLIIFARACSNDEPTVSTEDAYKYQACRDKTNTYYKCSWSVSENRCVCKQR